MGEVKHTAGPWRISTFEIDAGGADRMVMGADDFSVAYVSGRTAAEHDADAHLISAAPDMFEALANVKRVYQIKPERYPIPMRMAMQAVFAALAKASPPALPMGDGDDA